LVVPFGWLAWLTYRHFTNRKLAAKSDASANR